jgi:hypothetical protein
VNEDILNKIIDEWVRRSILFPGDQFTLDEFKDALAGLLVCYMI